MEINSRLWSTTKGKGCGELQDGKWRDMGKNSSVRVPCSQEGFKELVAAAQGSCALGTGAARDWGQGCYQQGSPHRILILLLPPSDVNTQFSWSQEKTERKALVICRALF